LSVTLEPSSIAAILTLRYDPTREPPKKPLQPSDFQPRNKGSEFESQILNIAKEDLVNTHNSARFRRAVLSLSGGVDSRLTLALIRHYLPEVKITCISAGFGDADDEVAKAKEYARNYDCDFHELMLDNILTDLPKLINLVREPRWNLYHYYTFEYGKKKSNFFYTGDGGDELFGGYTFRYHKFMSLYRKSADWKDKVKLYISCHERDWVPDQEKMFGKSIDFSWEKIYELIGSNFQNSLDPLDQVFLADFNGKLLFDWLPTNAAFATGLGLEIRSLFLSDRMIQFAFRLPWQSKYDPGRQLGKLPLRSLLRKQRGGDMDKELNKKGFSVALDFIWNKNAREITTKYLSADSEIVKSGLIDKDWLSTALYDLRIGAKELNPRYINKLLSLLALEIWHKLFIGRTMRPNEKL
jgi:asparagine synthase (glutamine-hydrolysing)